MIESLHKAMNPGGVFVFNFQWIAPNQFHKMLKPRKEPLVLGLHRSSLLRISR